uniref:Uncharacterized protein n=1 Tax=Arundo donax TaxID=35708 RepID=A0A0A9G5C5_ARUDO
MMRKNGLILINQALKFKKIQWQQLSQKNHVTHKYSKE